MGRGKSAKKSLAEKYPDVRPGVLSDELIKALGLKAGDAAPWAERMGELGAPPAYVEEEGGEEEQEEEGEGGEGEEKGEGEGARERTPDPDDEWVSRCRAGKTPSPE